MALRLQIIIIAFMLMIAIHIINLLRHKRLDFKYALGWLFVDFCILVLTVCPSLLKVIADFLGIASPMNMLFFFGFCFSLVIIFSLSMANSRLEDRVKKLSQEVAIVRKDMYDSDRRIESKIGEK